VIATTVLAQRAIESQTGQLAQLFVGSLPAELDKRVPLPQQAALIGSVVFTPLQYYAEHGTPGTIELYYDFLPGGSIATYISALQRAGWQQSPTAAIGSVIFCRTGGPAVTVSNPPHLQSQQNAQLRITVFRAHPGRTPC